MKKVLCEDYLIHSGIQGMKWGVRRYQNKDGSLTPEGRKRYGYTGERYAKKVRANKKLGMNNKLSEHLAYKSTNRNSKIMQGLRAWASGSLALDALETASMASALGAGGIAIAASIAAPAVAAASLTGYSVIRHFKNKKFHQDIRGTNKNGKTIKEKINERKNKTINELRTGLEKEYGKANDPTPKGLTKRKQKEYETIKSLQKGLEKSNKGTVKAKKTFKEKNNERNNKIINELRTGLEKEYGKYNDPIPEGLSKRKQKEYETIRKEQKDIEEKYGTQRKR